LIELNNEMRESIKVCIIEDNHVVRDGFEMLINNEGDYKVSGTFVNCEIGVKKVLKLKPDVILMDIELPGMSGIEGTRLIKKQLPETDVIVITDHEDSKLVFDALCAGATGYLVKSSNYSEIIYAIREVLSGGAPMSNHIARKVVESFQRSTNSPLTNRETEVLEHLAKGKSYSVIADELFIHKETVKSHIKNIYYKLQVNNKAQAIEKATSEKFI